MEIKPLPGNPNEAMVRFDSALEDELLNPHLLRSAARKILEVLYFVEPRRYPYTRIFSVKALHRREAEAHAYCHYGDGDFSPAASGVQGQMHGLVMEFGKQIRAVERAAWPDYER